MRVRFRVLPALACAAALAAPAARADEAIQTGAAGAPPVAEVPAPGLADPNTLQTIRDQTIRDRAIGDWARGVMAGETAQAAAPPARPGCAAPADHKPHGEVWAGVGTGGYRELGGVVTQPIGDCGSVTLAIDRTEGGGRRRR
jgi:hypothetical protein